MSGKEQMKVGQTRAVGSRIRGTLVVLSLLVAGSSIFWTDRLWPYFPRNAPREDLLLVLAYALIYGLTSGLVIWLGWHLLSWLLSPVRRLEIFLGRIVTGHLGGFNLPGIGFMLLPLLILGAVGILRHQHTTGETSTKPLQMALSWGPSPHHIQLIGVDGADLRHIERLLGQGELPNFKRLMAAGVSGPMKTISPHSPVVWTSIATGQPLSKTGVKRYRTSYLKGTGIAIPHAEADVLGRALEGPLGFRVDGAVSSNERRVRAMWEILTQFHLSSLVVNWWATYPAETIQGEIISNHLVPWSGFQREVLAEHGQTSGLTFPASLAPDLLVRLNQFVRDAGLEDVERNAFTVAGYQYYKARDSLVFEIYRDRLGDSSHRFDLSTVYMQGVDTASHAYTTKNFGRNINRRRDPRLNRVEDRHLWNTLVRGAYRTMDERLGILMGELAPDDILMLVSDHGWDYDGTSHWNKPDGIFMAMGGPVKKGKRIHAHVYDILPTIAQLLGLPISTELVGRVLRDALREDWLMAHPSLKVNSYGARGATIAVDPPSLDPSHIERLRSLGYVE